MKINRGIQIDGVNYTDKLLSVSDIDIGVRDLGFGYISDITVELVYDSSLLNVKGKEAIVGLLVDGNSYVYTGIVKKVNYKNKKITLNISHLSSVRKFLTAEFIYGNGEILYTELPIESKVIRDIGTGITGQPAYRANAGTTYFSIVNTNSYTLFGNYIFDPLGALQVGTKIETSFSRILNVSKDNNNKLVGDGIDFTSQSGNWGTSGAVVQFKNPAESNELLKVISSTNGFDVYGVKTYSSGVAYSETLISNGLVDPNEYPEVKLVCTSNTSDVPIVYIYRNDEIEQQNKELLPIFLQFNTSVYEPEDVIEDILLSQGFSVSRKEKPYSPKNIYLNFKVKDNAKNIIDKIAKQGLVYVIPNLNNDFDVVSVNATNIDVIYDTELLENSLSIDIEDSTFDKLKIKYNKVNLPGTDKVLPEQGETIYVGTGEKVEEVEANLIADSNSANNFGNLFLEYESKKEYVSFDTPLIQKFLNLNVGDVVTFYSLNFTYNRRLQIIQKTIRDESIKFKCKEV